MSLLPPHKNTKVIGNSYQLQFVTYLYYLLIKEVIKGVIIICLYVDDLLITWSNEGYITEFIGYLMEVFEMADLGLMAYFVVIEFHKSEKGVLIHQRRYAHEILKNFEIEHCNMIITHKDPRQLL